jgi:hypothetical protein
MSNRIGFVILSHANPPQLLRLVRTLRRIYDDPPIACHHDFSQCALSRTDFPSSVYFVQPHVRTRWGQYSVVDASLRALDLLYQKAAPEWFVLLSAADYPTMQPERVLKELASSDVDALLDYREVRKVSPESLFSDTDDARPHFESPGNLALAWRRYVGLNVWFPIVRKGPRIGRYTIYTSFSALRSPFDLQFKCFYGDFWLSANQKAVEILLKPTKKHLQLRRHLRLRSNPDECYYHTVLANAPQLKISKHYRRFSNWRGGPGFHPKELGLGDLSAIISANAYFARKFNLQSPVLDELDKILS